MLSKIRQSFNPLIPIRWKVIFTDPRLNIAGEAFPAKEVSYDSMTIRNIDVPLAPGISIPVAAIGAPVTSLSITFYEGSKYEIQKYFKEKLIDLDHGRGGFDQNLDVTIEEYNEDLSINTSTLFTVQLTDTMKRILVQQASAYESPLQFNVIGGGDETS